MRTAVCCIFFFQGKKDMVVLVPDLYWLKCCPTFIALKKVHSTACHATGRGKWIRIDAGLPPSPNLILLHCTTTLRFLCPLYTKADRHGIGKGAPIPRSYKHPCLCTHAISGLSPPCSRAGRAHERERAPMGGGGEKGCTGRRKKGRGFVSYFKRRAGMGREMWRDWSFILPWMSALRCRLDGEKEANCWWMIMKRLLLLRRTEDEEEG